MWASLAVAAETADAAIDIDSSADGDGPEILSAQSPLVLAAFHESTGQSQSTPQRRIVPWTGSMSSDSSGQAVEDNFAHVDAGEQRCDQAVETRRTASEDGTEKGGPGSAPAKRVRSREVSQYRGVSKGGDRSLGWQVRMQHNGRQHRMGSFPTEVGAAREYDKVALRLLGPLAVLNFPVADYELVTEDAHRAGWAECEKCGKWRKLAAGAVDWPGAFECAMASWSPAADACDKPEEHSGDGVAETYHGAPVSAAGSGRGSRAKRRGMHQQPGGDDCTRAFASAAGDEAAAPKPKKRAATLTLGPAKSKFRGVKKGAGCIRWGSEINHGSAHTARSCRHAHNWFAPALLSSPGPCSYTIPDPRTRSMRPL
jgi:hypothetical protein